MLGEYVQSSRRVFLMEEDEGDGFFFDGVKFIVGLVLPQCVP